MTWQQILREHLERWEKLRLDAYQDEAGVWTVGYGHTGPEVHPGMRISRQDAEELLAEDTAEAVASVERSVTHPMTAKMKAAAVSLVFNIGVGAWENEATARRRLNAGDLAGAAEAMTWWNKVTRGGVKVRSDGLVARREAERALFIEGVRELAGQEIAAAPQPTPKGRITGGEHKPLVKSKTFDTALLGTLLSGGSGIGTAIAGMDWRVAIAFLVVGGGFAFLGFNRWLEWKRGEH